MPNRIYRLSVLGLVMLTFLSSIFCAVAEAVEMRVPILQDISIVNEGNKISYPQMEGLENAELQQRINDLIITKANITNHILTFSRLQPGGWGLVMEYDSFLRGNVLSLSISTKGEMPEGREGHNVIALCFDLRDGHLISSDELFADKEGAITYMEQALEYSLTDELSSYLENTQFIPIPIDHFFIDETGLTFFYSSEQFSMLSGYCGACHFFYEEIEEYLNWTGLLGEMGVQPKKFSDIEARANIQECVTQGRLPYIPIAIGDSMIQIVETYRLLREPDQYPGGKYYQLEDPLFRQVQVMGDELGYRYEESKVVGLQSTRSSLYGLTPGETKKSRWREILGEPESTVDFTQELAYSYNLPIGLSDFYLYGDYQLRLHADESGTLHSIRISK